MTTAFKDFEGTADGQIRGMLFAAQTRADAAVNNFARAGSGTLVSGRTFLEETLVISKPKSLRRSLFTAAGTLAANKQLELKYIEAGNTLKKELESATRGLSNAVVQNNYIRYGPPSLASINSSFNNLQTRFDSSLDSYLNYLYIIVNSIVNYLYGILQNIINVWQYRKKTTLEKMVYVAGLAAYLASIVLVVIEFDDSMPSWYTAQGHAIWIAAVVLAPVVVIASYDLLQHSKQLYTFLKLALLTLKTNMSAITKKLRTNMSATTSKQQSAIVLYIMLFIVMVFAFPAAYAPLVAAGGAYAFLVMYQPPKDHALFILGIVSGMLGLVLAQATFNHKWFVTIIGLLSSPLLPVFAPRDTKHAINDLIAWFIPWFIANLRHYLDQQLIYILGQRSRAGRNINLIYWSEALKEKLRNDTRYRQANEIVGRGVPPGKPPTKYHFDAILDYNGIADEQQALTVAFVISRLRPNLLDASRAVHKKGKEDLIKARSAVRLIWQKLKDYSRKGPNTAVNVCKWISIVCLSPVLLPLVAAYAAGQYIVAGFLPELDQSSIVTLAGFLFVAYTAIAYALHAGTDAALASGVFVVMGALGAFANQHVLVAGPLLGLAFEAVFTVHPASLVYESVYTLCAFLLLLITARKEPKYFISVNYTVIWLLFRVFRISTKTKDSAQARWQSAQIMLLAIVLKHLWLRFGRSSNQTTSQLDTQFSGTLILLTALTYTDKNVLPLHINVWGIVLPLSYAACISLPANSYQENSGRSLFMRAGEALVSMGVGTIVTICFFYPNRPTPLVAQNDPCNPLLTNLHTCGDEPAEYFATLLPSGVACCRGPGYILVPNGNWPQLYDQVRAVPQTTCTQPIMAPASHKDCCNKERTKSTDWLLGGPLACLCNCKVNGNCNDYVYDGDTKHYTPDACSCNANWTGTACHIPSL